jgi:hypothetical protein
MQPEVIPLCVRVGNVGTANPLNIVKQGSILQHSSAQFRPVQPFSACYHVVDGGWGKILMIEVSMQHYATNGSVFRG